MGFVTEYKNYGNVTIPLYKISGDLSGSYITTTKTINDKSYSIRYIDESVIGLGIYEGFEISTVVNTYFMYVIKSKNSDKYISFIDDVQQYSNPWLTCKLSIAYSEGDSPTSLSNVTNIIGNTIGFDYREPNKECFMIESTNYFYFVYQYRSKFSGEGWRTIWRVQGISKSFINEYLGEIEIITYSLEYGTPSGSGGYSGGSFDNSSDTIAIPNKPSIGVTNVGFVNVYNPSTSGLVNLGSELFPDFTPPQAAPLSADITEALQLGFNNVVENITNFTNMFINSKLIDYVIDCHVIPIKPTVSESESIKIGFKSFNQTANKVTSDYIDFDCGNLNIKEYYTNFIDYVGTRAKLYLPFVGFVPIENEYFQNGTLNVKYRFNVIDGSFMCYVIASSSKSQLKNSVIASYGGNACVHIPITGLNYSNMITGLASGTVATIATASIGGGLASKALSPALASAGVAVGTLNSALNTLATKPSMQSSNGYNSTSAYLGIRYPYLVIEREVSNFSEYYTSENGLPCNITKTINELSGYVEMDNIHMETLTCTDDEKTMIENLLKSGIIV